MKFKEWFVKSEIIFNEGQAEDLIERNPELKIAYDSGVINPNYLKWLLKAKEHEPIEDVFPLIKSFEEKKNRLDKKDINAYTNPNELRLALEELGISKTQAEKQLKEEEAKKIGQFGDWIVVMPETIASSCQYGRGTTWCTTATQSANMFLNIVMDPSNKIILYYLINKNVDPKANPNGKISLAYLNNIPYLDGRNGGLTVNADNDGINERKLKQILKDQYEPIIKATTEHAKSLNGSHPLKTKIEKIIESNNLEEFKNFISKLTQEEFKNSIDSFASYTLPLNFIEFLIKKYGEEIDSSTIYRLLSANQFKKMEIAEKIIEEFPNLSPQSMETILIHMPHDVERIAKKLGSDNIKRLYNDPNPYTKITILKHLINNLENPRNAIISSLGEEFIDSVDVKGIQYVMSQYWRNLENFKKAVDVFGTKNLQKLKSVNIWNILNQYDNLKRDLVLSILRQHIPEENFDDDYMPPPRIIGGGIIRRK